MRCFLFAVSMLVGLNCTGQGFLKTEGDQIVNEAGDTVILRGMGLGGWMLQEGYMLQTAEFAGAQWQIEQAIEDLVGKAEKEKFYQSWYDNHVTRKDIDSLAAWGFNLIRLPMHYKLFTLPIQEEPVADEHTWLEQGFVMTDSLVSWCKANNMYVLLDLHAAPGGQGYNQGISDYNPIYPSLWEDNANKRKTIALWKRLAERYIDEPTIAGYDLLNEPNWDLPGNSALRALYQEITTEIRATGDEHMVFIEGDWLANYFSALSIPWDDNMVYAPHKYWSNNEKEDLRWMLDIRDNTGVPVFFGESGENSNTWFRDAIRNFEDNGMGWAWWPEKKVESISGPLSIVKTPAYERLLSYWKGTGAKPFIGDAINTLNQFAEDLKIENCIFQKDVIDAMFRQVYSDEVKPYSIQTVPGVVYASEFDMGRNGIAYYDTQAGNYELSTGEFTPWNSGWAYRNDGVDIERSADNINSNGYNVGFMETGEWIQYSIAVEETAVYEAHIRYAAGSGNGEFHLGTNNGDLHESNSLPNTLGWDKWRTYVVEDLILTQADDKLIFHVDHSGFNLGSIEFVKTGETSDLEALFVSAVTADENTIEITVNKPLAIPINLYNGGFRVIVNGNPFTVTEAEIIENGKTILVTVANTFASSHIINVSYTGDAIMAIDGTLLSKFSQRLVKNTILGYLNIPGKIEAEAYSLQSGIQLEQTTDAGGGQNIAYLDVGDYADYYVNVDHTGTYNVEYRTASQAARGEVELFLVTNGGLRSLHTASFAPTGDWQAWESTTKRLDLDKGKHQLRMVINAPMFNMNWMRFSSLTSVNEMEVDSRLQLYPNPAEGEIHITLEMASVQKVNIELVTLSGQLIENWQQEMTDKVNFAIPVSGLNQGVYFIRIKNDKGILASDRFVKI